MTNEPVTVREPEGREHLVYTDEFGRPEECIEECPGCHWEGNTECEALASGCDLCDPDGLWAGGAQFLARRDEIAQYLAYEYEQPVDTAKWRAQELMAKVQVWIDEARQEGRDETNRKYSQVAAKLIRQAITERQS